MSSRAIQTNRQHRPLRSANNMPHETTTPRDRCSMHTDHQHNITVETAIPYVDQNEKWRKQLTFFPAWMAPRTVKRDG
jgi:hypothetical protein